MAAQLQRTRWRSPPCCQIQWRSATGSPGGCAATAAPPTVASGRAAGWLLSGPASWSERRTDVRPQQPAAACRKAAVP
eukprot:5488248-Alexandrium_andersonii.AAC.1